MPPKPNTFRGQRVDGAPRGPLSRRARGASRPPALEPERGRRSPNGDTHPFPKGHPAGPPISLHRAGALVGGGTPSSPQPQGAQTGPPVSNLKRGHPSRRPAPRVPKRGHPSRFTERPHPAGGAHAGLPCQTRSAADVSTGPPAVPCLAESAAPPVYLLWHPSGDTGLIADTHLLPGLHATS